MVQSGLAAGSSSGSQNIRQNIQKGIPGAFRSGLASDETAGSRPKVLILGSKGVAQIIARQIAVEGFEPVLWTDWAQQRPLPLPGSPSALEDMKAALEQFAKEAGPAASGYAHCVHPGVSAWAERSELALLGQQFGLNVICPPVRVTSLFSNRLNFLGEAERLSIPNLVLSFDPIHSVREVEALMSRREHRFPFVLKSIRGGAGFGLQVVHQPDDLERKLNLWLEQLRKNYGEAIVFAERYLDGSRHVVVPFVRFADGHVEIFPISDASLQSRYRKVVEICPATGIESEAEAKVVEWSRQLAAHCGYVGVGAFEFLVDGTRAFLVDGLARLDTGFHLWEKVAGTSAVAWQLAALRGGTPDARPTRQPQREWSSALALRLYAEDPMLQLPQPGTVMELSDRREWRLPGGSAELFMSLDASSVDSDSGGASEEWTMDFSGDGFLGVLFVGAHDRQQALTMARGILSEIWIAGTLQTNERFLAELLAHPWVREGIFHAGFVDEEFVPEIRPAPEVLRAFAAVCGTIGAQAQPGATGRWAVGDQWVRPDPAPLHWVGEPRRFNDENGRPGVSGKIELPEGRQVPVLAFPLASENRWQVRIQNWVLSVRYVIPDPAAKRSGRQRLMALTGGKVHSILFREGTLIPAHETIIVIESLQALVPHALPVDVRVVDWNVNAEDSIATGQELALFEISKGE